MQPNRILAPDPGLPAGFGAILLSWLFLYLPWLSGRVVMPYDAIDENYPTLFFVSQALRHGQMPWWNPSLFCGFPQIADPQALTFSPLVTGLMALIPQPTPHCLDLIVLLHILIGGIGTFLFLRALRVSAPAGVFGAIIAMAGGCAPARLEHTALVIATCTLPWVALALLALCRRPTIWRGVLFGLAVGWMGLLLVQTTYIALLLITVSVAACFILGPAPRLRRLRDAVPPFLVAGLVTVAVCGVQVAAVLTFLPETVRSHLDLSASAWNSAPPRLLLTFLWPNAMHTFSANYDQSIIDISESIVYCGYLGAVTCILGIAATIWRLVSRPRAAGTQLAVLLLILLGFCVLYALGTHTVFYGLLYRFVPGITLFRRPVDAMFIATLFVAAFAAFGLDLVLLGARARLAPAKGRMIILGLLAVLPTVLLCWDLHSHTLTPNRTNAWPAGFVAQLPDHYPSIRFLRAATRNPGQPDWRIELNQPAPLWPDLPAATGLYSTQGYNPLQESHYATVFGTTPNGYQPIQFTPWLANYAAPLFAVLSVKYIVSWSGTPADEQAEAAGLKHVLTADGMDIWENSNRVPRLFSPAAAVSATADQAPRIAAGIRDPRQTVVVEGSSAAVRACGPGRMTAITLIKYHDTAATIRAEVAGSSAWLVMTDPATRGWHAYVDGRETPLFRADAFMRAVCVPAGAHAVAFRFEPFRQIAQTILSALPR